MVIFVGTDGLRAGGNALRVGLATRAAAAGGVPAGASALVTDDEAPEFRMGRRIDLPVS